MAKKRFNEHPFPYHQEVQLEITTLTNLGVGLARVPIKDPATGEETQWVVMCAFALPGELVRARVFRNHKNYSEADLLSVLRPSPHRVPAPCVVFGRCGGCQYQNLRYDQQLVWKRQQVEELLRYMAGIEFPVAPVIGSPQSYGYRSKITPHFNAPRFDVGAVPPPRSPSVPPRRTDSDVGAVPSPRIASDGALQPAASVLDERTFPIGFLRQGTRFDLVDVPRCEIATERINVRLGEARQETRQRALNGEFKRGGTLLLREASGQVTTEYDAVITETVGDLKLRFLARDFFQNNPFILPAFTRYVREQAAASGATKLVDAYCGSGLFALGAASAFEAVAGIEISETSIEFARQNATANGITNAEFRAGDAAAIFQGLRFPAADTAVVIDPPRKGCDEAFLQQLFSFGPRAVVYVSCDPATQMRDLKQFLSAGYHLTAVQPFDLFPQTRHLECVITLRRDSGH